MCVWGCEKLVGGMYAGTVLAWGIFTGPILTCGAELKLVGAAARARSDVAVMVPLCTVTAPWGVWTVTGVWVAVMRPPVLVGVPTAVTAVFGAIPLMVWTTLGDTRCGRAGALGDVLGVVVGAVFAGETVGYVLGVGLGGDVAGGAVESVPGEVPVVEPDMP